MTVHPIEVESYRRLEARVDLSSFGPLARDVVARVIHASADLEFASSMVVDDDAVTAGVDALRRSVPVVCDVEMVRAGVTGVDARCYLSDVSEPPPGLTRAAAAMRIAAERHPAGAIIAVGCAPTALIEAIRLASTAAFAPALIVGLPVGFVGAAESKAALRQTSLPAISNVGEKGGSAVAAAAVNAIGRLAHRDS